MRDTRSSTRKTSGSDPSSSPSNVSGAGTKRKSETTPSSKAKRGKKGEEKQQITLEQSLQDKQEDETAKDVPMEEVEQDITSAKKNGSTDALDSIQQREDAVKAREDAIKEKEEAATEGAVDDEPANQELKDEKSSDRVARAQEPNTKTNGSSKMDDTGKIVPKEESNSVDEKPSLNEGDAVEVSSQREESTPSSILEKGIIYFFFRGRVGIDEPSDINDLARSYMVLRPLPHGAKLGDGPIGDAGTNRLLALPKKVLPVSPRDRFMIFVEKANCSMEDIKQDLGASDYVTQTAGARHTPAATPIAEGIYAITTTGRESHLAYILTIPSELSEVQRDVGLRERGSFVTSVKNPKYAGPANTNLPKGPDFPQEVLDEFRSLRWAPLQPKFLGYENAQFIVIGSGVEDLSKATDQQNTDEKHNADTALEEMEKLGHEDEIRAEHLKGDDTVFEDLGLSLKEYPKVQTTW